MKLIILILLVCACTVEVKSQTTIQWIGIHIIRGICQLKTGVDGNLVLQVRAWNFSANDQKLNKYIFCVYNHLNIMDDQANINIKSALSILPAQTDPATFLRAVDACKGETGPDIYTKAFNSLKCYNIQYPKDIIAL